MARGGFKRLFGKIMDEVKDSHDEEVVWVTDSECQQLYFDVAKYRRENPEASWEAIFKKFPNKYVDARSMKNAMNNRAKKTRNQRMRGKGQ